jgi:hypothetical protein
VFHNETEETDALIRWRTHPQRAVVLLTSMQAHTHILLPAFLVGENF